MEYFKINYYKLQNLSQLNFYKIIIFIILNILILLIVGCFISIYNKASFSAIYNNNILTIKINNKLSDTLKNNKYIVFNDVKTGYEILEYGEYEIIGNEIYQKVNLSVDKEFINNEVGIVELYYNKQRIIKYIFELFK